jgi:hypothetical protein
MADTEHRTGHTTEPAYEASDVSLVPIAGFLVILFSATAASFFVGWLCFRYLISTIERNDPALPPMAAARKETGPPSPHLLLDEPSYVRGVREGEHDALEGYAWADKQHGKARIPIERALDLVAEEGLPVRSGNANAEGVR